MSVGRRCGEACAQIQTQGFSLDQSCPDFINDFVNETASRPYWTFRLRDGHLSMWRCPKQHSLAGQSGMCDPAMVGNVDESIDGVACYAKGYGGSDVSKCEWMRVEGPTALRGEFRKES